MFWRVQHSLVRLVLPPMRCGHALESAQLLLPSVFHVASERRAASRTEANDRVRANQRLSCICTTSAPSQPAAKILSGTTDVWPGVRRDVLSTAALADSMQAFLPEGLSALSSIVRNWTFSLFYLMSELWGSVVVSVLVSVFLGDCTKRKNRSDSLRICSTLSGDNFSVPLFTIQTRRILLRPYSMPPAPLLVSFGASRTTSCQCRRLSGSTLCLAWGPTWRLFSPDSTSGAATREVDIWGLGGCRQIFSSRLALARSIRVGVCGRMIAARLDWVPVGRSGGAQQRRLAAVAGSAAFWVGPVRPKVLWSTAADVGVHALLSLRTGSPGSLERGSAGVLLGEPRNTVVVRLGFDLIIVSRFVVLKAFAHSFAANHVHGPVFFRCRVGCVRGARCCTSFSLRAPFVPGGGGFRLVSSVRQSLPPDADKWGVSLQLLMGAVVAGGVVVAGCYRWMQENVITDPECVDAGRCVVGGYVQTWAFGSHGGWSSLVLVSFVPPRWPHVHSAALLALRQSRYSSRCWFGVLPPPLLPLLLLDSSFNLMPSTLLRVPCPYCPLLSAGRGKCCRREQRRRHEGDNQPHAQGERGLSRGKRLPPGCCHPRHSLRHLDQHRRRWVDGWVRSPPRRPREGCEGGGTSRLPSLSTPLGFARVIQRFFL